MTKQKLDEKTKMVSNFGKLAIFMSILWTSFFLVFEGLSLDLVCLVGVFASAFFVIEKMEVREW